MPLTRLLFLLSLLILLPSGTFAKPLVTWNPSNVSQTVLIGTVISVPVTFTTNEPLSNVRLEVIPALVPLVAIIPSSFDQLVPGVAYSATLVFTMPKNTGVKKLDGVIQIKDGSGTVAKPLSVKVETRAATLANIPATVALPSPDRLVTALGGTVFVKDEVDIIFREGAPESTVRTVVAQAGGVFVGSIPDFPLYQVLLSTEGFDNIRNIIELIEQHPDVEFATHHFTVKVDKTPNDIGFSLQDTSLAINLPAAWDITTGRKTISTPQGTRELGIGIIDSEFDNNHEDLRSNIVTSDSGIPMANDHGTAVAGIVAAKGNNSTGITGTMWDASLRLYSTINPLYGPLYTDMDYVLIAQKGRQAIQDGVRIINFSGGIGCTTCSPQDEFFRDRFDQTFKNLIEKAKREGVDILWVFSAGNNKINVSTHSPARLSDVYSNVVNVSATTRPGGFLATFSNFGKKITVAAPGFGVLTTAKDNVYTNFDGTSASAPFVTGVAGLMLSENPHLTAPQLRMVLRYSAEFKGFHDPEGNEIYLLNAFNAVNTARSAFPQGDGSFLVLVRYPASRLPDVFPSDFPLEDLGDFVFDNFAAATARQFQQSRHWTSTRTVGELLGRYQNYFSTHGWNVFFSDLSFGTILAQAPGAVLPFDPNAPIMNVSVRDNPITGLRVVRIDFSNIPI